MKLAINYSSQTADLLSREKVSFDLYKTTEWPEMIAAAEVQRPAYVHFPLMADIARRDRQVQLAEQGTVAMPSGQITGDQHGTHTQGRYWRRPVGLPVRRL